MAYCVETFVLAREGIEFIHEGGDLTDHVGAYYCDRWMRTTTEHVVLCIILPTEWAGEWGRVLICGALHHLRSVKVPVVRKFGDSCTFSIGQVVG